MTDAERAEKEEQHEAALSAVRDLPCTEVIALLILRTLLTLTEIP